MENDNPLIDQADELIASLDNGPPDTELVLRLRQWITEAKSQIAEIRLLRSDLIARIAGMAKAVAVARNSKAGLQDASEMVAECNQLDAAALIAAYRKTAARFRDTFRSTFDSHRMKPPKSKAQPANINDYK